LFRGLVSPQAIEKVYLVSFDKDGNFTPGRIGEFKRSLSPEEFLQIIVKGGSQKPRKLMTEPQEIMLTPDDLLDRLVKKYGTMTKRGEDTEWIEKIIREAIDPARHQTYQSQISGLMHLAGGPTMQYSVAKRLLPQFLARYGMKAAPNKYERMKKGPWFG
jgi:hypothetical protein